MRESKIGFASLISGGGTTMEAMARACQEDGELYGLAQPVVVISSREGVAGIQRAIDLGIPVEVLPRNSYDSTDDYGAVLAEILGRYTPDVVTLNGFMVKVSEEVISKYSGRIYNQHPGPVPEFGGPGMYGRRVHAAVLIWHRLLKRDIQYSEMVAQRVAPEFDQGAVVASAQVQIWKQDTVDSLQEHSLPIEHEVQIELLRKLAQGTVTEINRHPFPRTPAEYLILDIAKEAAKTLYPSG